MALFQSSVLKDQLRLQDEQQVEKAYKKFTAFFHNPETYFFTKKDEFEWMELFEENKLYGLTEEEIAIVEFIERIELI